MTDKLHELYAWRTWGRLEDTLISPVAATVWNGPQLKATHNADASLREHPPGEGVPARNCGCGIWGLFERPRMDETSGLFVLGVIKLCPPAVLGTRGVRCAAAEIRHLFVPAGTASDWDQYLVEVLEKRYDCPVTVVRNEDELAAIAKEWEEKVWRSAAILRSLAGGNNT